MMLDLCLVVTHCYGPKLETSVDVVLSWASNPAGHADRTCCWDTAGSFAIHKREERDDDDVIGLSEMHVQARSVLPRPRHLHCVQRTQADRGLGQMHLVLCRVSMPLYVGSFGRQQAMPKSAPSP